MSVNLPIMGVLEAIPGIRVGTADAEIRDNGRDDITVFAFEPGATVGGVYTRNSYRAAPVEIASACPGPARGFVVNSGNANAATGERGVQDAQQICGHFASLLECDATKVLPFSTGVIGEFLPVEKIRTGIDRAYEALSPNRWTQAATAIMTTDTAPKGLSNHFKLGGREAIGTGIVKGSGMIRPDMATLLAFVGTNASLTPEIARRLTFDLAEVSFNRLTVDGDTSTNDSFALVASGIGDHETIHDQSSVEYSELLHGLTPIVRELAVRTVRDAEGATRFITIHVQGGRDVAECMRVAYTVAHSPLVKTALFAGDPNWGRFCMAIGRAGINDLDPYQVSLNLNDVQVAAGGMVADSYREEEGAEVMARDEYEITIDLGRGSSRETIWTSDLSYEYVRINAEYRS
ncbi:MAG: bifunctional glutamate N-acetyltransferase/amino-acid acetyltransferase ArgJ [Pseudomonadota bacterium]|nr:bifunctional glutamate N-acetyltransferase/amino-acid acetyltransferase ArgJ [Pseudomonadota bacterium]